MSQNIDISLLLPTRQRPEQLKRFYESAMDTADKPFNIEVVVYIDKDDRSYDTLRLPRMAKIKGERIVLSEMWNRCWKIAKGDIFGHMGDDIVFKTKGWDTEVKNAIDSFPKKIGFVWGDDKNDQSQQNEFGTHGFIHRNWTDVIGRFVPPYYESDYNDTHFNDVSKELGVQKYLHHVVTEHYHYTVGKAEMDQNTEERLERHTRQKPEEIYYSQEKRIERLDEVEKLRQFIENGSV